MNFIDKWQDSINTSLEQSARLATNTQQVDLEYALMATGVLWPLRQPVQEFDMEAIGLVNELVGSEAKHILRVVQSWDDDMLTAAQDLNTQLTNNTELDIALKVISKKFRAYFLFTEHLSNQPKAYTLTSATDSPPPEEIDTVTSDETSKDQPARVFVSYARSDGEQIAKHLGQRLEKEKIPVWQDRVNMQGGRDWWLQITDALNQVEFMVLVMTPAAMKSEIVQREWRYARQQGVCVYPIKAAADLHFTNLPRWMRNVHFYDLDIEWPKLAQDLNNPCQTPRVPFMAEELPDDFIPRTEQLSQITSLLLDENKDPVATNIALQGTGGYGKTVLAKALCHNEDIRQAFDDGIVWVTLGKDPGDLAGYIIDLVEVLSGERPGFAGMDAAETRLGQLLADRDILMVIDDVWNVAHLKPFMRGGVGVARIITTRNVTVVPPRAHQVEVATMNRNEAVTLLSMALPDGPIQPFHDLAERLGHWPLLLKLTNGALRDRVQNNNQPLSDALAYVNKALDKRGLTAFDAHNAADRDQAVSQTLGVSQELLTDDERVRYGELAIFPGEINIPLTVLTKLWNATGGLDDFDTEELCNRFNKLSLLAHFDPNEHYITLHNIVRNYLAQDHEDELIDLHHQLLKAYEPQVPSTKLGIPRWANLPSQERYLWAYMAYHLIMANRGGELIDTVKDMSYLVNKTNNRTAFATEADLLAARQVDPDDLVLTRLHQSLSQANHLLNQAKTIQEIANIMHSRVAHVSALKELVELGQPDLPKPLLTSFQRLPDLPDSSLIRTLTGHGVAVLACDISADGSTIASMARDTTLKIWDAQTGAETFTLVGHKVIGNSCAISADGSIVVSATWDGVLKIWDANNGTERFSIKAHAGSLFGCAISPDETIVVTAAKDKTLKVWDANTGTERFTLTGHERSATGCAISDDGSTIISSSPDGTVKIWDTNSGQLKISLKSYEVTESHKPSANLTFTAASSALLSCAISGDGSIAVAALPDGVLKVWNVNSGHERFVLSGHSGWIENCAISADGSLIISVSNDKTVRGWDANTGANKFTLEGHMRAISGCAVSADGKTIVSASQDKTMKLWDTESGDEKSTQTDHISAAQTCAISANNQTVIFNTTGNALKVLNAHTAAEQFTLKGHMRPITGCAISPAGSTIVTSSQDRTLKIWDAPSGKERTTLRGHMWTVNDCALSNDGNMIVSVSEDSTLKIWDAHTGKERFTLGGHMRAVNSCTISPDGSFIVSASADKTLKVWDTHTGTDRFTLKGHTSPVNSCAVSANNLLIASASNDDLVKIWDSQTGQELLTLAGHTSSVFRCAFSPDGQYLLSVSKDRSLRLWSIQTGHVVTTLQVDGPLSSCAWYPDSQHILAVGSRGAYFLRLIK